METIEAIMTRRSVRKYTSQEVSEEQVEQLLRAGMQAPSANNGQPWHFVVIRDRAILDEIPKFHPYAQMLKSAPLAILVCADLAHTNSPDYWMVDCSAATENILLAAHVLGIGCRLDRHLPPPAAHGKRDRAHRPAGEGAAAGSGGGRSPG